MIKKPKIKAYKDTVVYAPGRDERPFISKAEKEKCPFCPGNESLTPVSTAEIRKNGKWFIRSLPNKYPAFSSSETLNFGYHEVIVETPDHEKDISSYSNNEYEKVLNLYKKRMVSVLSKPGIESVLLFKNYGIKAGASIFHAHSQLVGMGSVPEQEVLDVLEKEKYFIKNKICRTCFEIQEKGLDVFRSDLFIVKVPKRSKFSYEMEIIPTRHVGGYEELNESELQNLAEVIKQSLVLLKVQLSGNINYNMLFSTTIKNEHFKKSKHFQINLIPRLSLLGGFELATGLYINSVLPQVAAQSLRSIYLKQKVV